MQQNTISKNSLKICLHTGPNINPESRDIVDITPDKERLREYITKNFPNVEPTPSIEESCIYTVSTSMKITMLIKCLIAYITYL